MYYLFYMYLGISTSATQYWTEYQLYTFSSGNLTNVNSASRIHTQINNNVAGESYPNYLTNKISNVIWLAGFKMNLGTTGTYINLTSSIVSASTHSITIATINDVQILQVCYFRFSFDKTVVTQSYLSTVDQWSFYGINGTQYPYTTTMSSTTLMYRNYMMGINYIHIATTTASTDFMLAFKVINPSWELMWTSASSMFTFVFPTFAYLQGQAFNHRIRTCPIANPYYLYNTEQCYDVCIDRTYNVTDTAKYCQLCHFSCLTCTGRLNTNCVTCSGAVDFRQKNTTDSTCVCMNGYYQSNVQICSACIASCKTCQGSAQYCLSCDSVSQHRSINMVSHVCECGSGFYETGLNTPTICLSCDYKCLTCSSSSTNCTSCDSIAHRVYDAPTFSCPCIAKFYQDTTTSSGCLPCDYKCLTCSSSSTHCTSCDTTVHRIFDSSAFACPCVVGYYQDTATNTGCKPCTIVGCQACALQPTSNIQSCTLCDTTLNFTLSTLPLSSPPASTCTCISQNYYDTTSNSCLACNYRCASCSASSSCDTCSPVNFRTNNPAASPFCSCLSGYYEVSNQPVCLQCDIKCLTCASASTNCVSCDTATRYYSLSPDMITYTCYCNTGTQQSTTTYGLCVPIPPSPTSICGNGIVQAPEQCDDYNTIALDGCSASCLVQEYHTCQTYSNGNGTSLCFYNKPLDMEIQSVLKLLNDNKISIVIKIQALLCNLDSLKLYLNSLNAVQLSNARLLLQQNYIFQPRLLATSIIYISSANFYVYDASNYLGYLTLVLDYTQSIQTLQNRQLQFLSSNNENKAAAQNYFFATPTSNIRLQDPHNKVPMTFYQTSSYSLSGTLSYVFLVINCLNIVFWVVAVMLRKSVIAIEAVLIYQLAYFSVIGQQYVELTIASLAYFGRYSMGLHINIMQTQVSDVVTTLICPKLGKIYQQCNAIDNINITFIIATATFLAAIIMLAYKLRQQRLLDQVPITQRQSQYQSTKGNPQNNEPNKIEYFNEMSQAKSVTNLTYELPPKIQLILIICLQITMGLYFMTAIEYMLLALNLNDQAKIASIAWLSVIGVLFAAMWVTWFYFYPVCSLSYITVLRRGIQKLSLVKLVYLYMFVFLVMFGIILSSAPGIASYALLIVFAVTWLYLTVRRNIYNSKYNKIRSIINQAIIISISIIFIMLEYAVKDGLGLIPSLILLILLLLSLVTNIGFFIFDFRADKINDQLAKDDQKLNEVASEFIKYTSRGGKQTPNTALSKIPVLQQYEITSPQKQPLMDPVEMKQLAKSKMRDLKTFRQQLKLVSSSRLADEKKVQMLSELRKMGHQDSSQITANRQQYINL